MFVHAGAAGVTVGKAVLLLSVLGLLADAERGGDDPAEREEEEGGRLFGVMAEPKAAPVVAAAIVVGGVGVAVAVAV